MATKHCCYGTCTSDSRYSDTDNMKGVSFIRFPKPYKQRKNGKHDSKLERQKNEKCKRWIHACGRPTSGPNAFTIQNINKDTYICSRHFIGNNGPTDEHPDPIIATKVTLAYIFIIAIYIEMHLFNC